MKSEKRQMSLFWKKTFGPVWSTWGGGGGGGGGGGSEGLEDRMCVGVRVCACVDAGEREGTE